MPHAARGRTDGAEGVGTARASLGFLHVASRLSLTRRGRVLLGVGAALALASAAWVVVGGDGPAPDPGATGTEEPTAPPPVIEAQMTVRTPVERSGRRVAADLGVPVLPSSTPELPTVLDQLGTEVVVHVVPGGATSSPAAMGDREVRTVPVDEDGDLGGLPDDVRPAEPPEDGQALLLVPEDDPARAALASLVRATGNRMLPIEDELVASPAAVSTLQDRKQAPWVAAGTREAWSGRHPELLEWDVPVVRRGVELPGGGYRVFPGRRLVALYGSPGAPSLGVLGEQPLDAAIERARQRASDYEALVDEPVVPTFEIITTIATGAAGPDGDYSREIPPEELRPWIERTAGEDMYVILDLQPGRTDFVTQAKRYEELLAHPHVGLALDPEWRLGANERHLEQIGSVDVAEVQAVADWLAQLTRREQLPQKLLLLHQFRLSMLPDRAQLELPPELAVTVQMDGQGPQEVKMATWRNITNPATPDGLWFGWKNFYDEDTTLRSPADTFGVEPSPVLVSYQ